VCVGCREQEERSRGELRRDDDYDDDAVDANPFRPIDQQLRAAQVQIYHTAR